MKTMIGSTKLFLFVLTYFVSCQQRAAACLCACIASLFNIIHFGAVGKGAHGSRSGAHDDDEDEMGGGGQRVQCAQQ
jgi:hypothetical protein